MMPGSKYIYRQIKKRLSKRQSLQQHAEALEAGRRSVIILEVAALTLSLICHVYCLCCNKWAILTHIAIVIKANLKQMFNDDLLLNIKM